jgi:hypothetical protein
MEVQDLLHLPSITDYHLHPLLQVLVFKDQILKLCRLLPLLLDLELKGHQDYLHHLVLLAPQDPVGCCHHPQAPLIQDCHPRQAHQVLRCLVCQPHLDPHLPLDLECHLQLTKKLLMLQGNQI